MRRVFVFLLLAGILGFPFSAQAQNPIKLKSLQIQLWPEYDQPSMLVIYDFKLPENVKLPVSVSLSFPKEGHLVAVASLAADNSLLNTDYIGPTQTQNAQTVTIQVQTPTTYHVEYYQPLSRTGKERQFTYTWPGDYPVDDISVDVRVPSDTTNLVTDPEMKSAKAADGTPSLIKDFGSLAAGQQFPLKLTYTRASDAPSVQTETVQPSRPLDPRTPGRVLLSNYVPYALGALGAALIGAAAIYFLQPHRRQAASRRRSHGGRTEKGSGKEIYCHQCGTRAQGSDRFCRVCGTRLRMDE
ncbi:MAG TPA: zinc ribbon domain-containing protein [Anaerolineales bacterium]|nr:zinc ribbon domain-containing protein [Anaerolineales bacterium]